jgi:hypothetical protein
MRLRKKEAPMPAFDRAELTYGWFPGFFEGDSLSAYLGNRQRLEAALAERPLWRKAVDIFLKRVNLEIKLDLRDLLDGFLGRHPKKDGGTAQPTAGAELRDLFEKEESKNRIKRFMQRLKDQDQAFNMVEALGSRGLKKLDGELITVFGQLLHSSAQTDQDVARQLGSFRGWMLTDSPPDSFKDDPSIMKKILLLKEDPPFTSFFGEEPPFDEAIGWYPYVQATGFLDASRIASQNFPTLQTVMIHYRRAAVLKEKQQELLNVASKILKINKRSIKVVGEDTGRGLRDSSAGTGRKLECNESEAILFGYLAPLLFARMGKPPSEADAELTTAILEFRQIRQAELHSRQTEMPKKLDAFYSALPQNKNKGSAAGLSVP